MAEDFGTMSPEEVMNAADRQWRLRVTRRLDALAKWSHPPRDFPRWPGYVAIGCLLIQFFDWACA